MKNRNRILALMCAAAAMAGANGANAATINIGADIATDTTWTSNNVYVLQQPIFITNGATLTVHAGTVIRGEKEFTTDPGALIVSRGSKVRMMGTETAPIVMTTTNDDHFVGPTPVVGTPPWSTPNNGLARLWGGLILLGNAYIATDDGGATVSPNASLSRQIEGLVGDGARYGGGNDDDDSGEVHYVSIRYGGFVLGDANEINGMTFGAVGRGTDVDHVEVFQNKDDGFEFFGSTVNTKYLMAWVDGDDGFDWDEGYRGKAQFWLRVQGPLSGEGDLSDKGSEMDGGDGDSSQPSSCPTIYNATYIGTGRDSGYKKNTALMFRDGTGGRFYNSLFMDFGGAPALIEGSLGGSHDSADYTVTNYASHLSSYYTHETGGKMLELKNNYFWKFGTNLVPAYSSGATNDAFLVWGSDDAAKAHLGYPLFSDASLSNTYVDAGDAPISNLVRSATGVTLAGKGTFYPIEFLDPVLIEGSPLLSGGRMPPADGFYTPVRMLGAFGTKNWAGWSVASKLGLMESATYGSYTDPQISASYVAATVAFPTVAGGNYTVQYTTNEATMAWANLATGLSGTGIEYKYTDQRPITEARVYRVLSSELAP